MFYSGEDARLELEEYQVRFVNKQQRLADLSEICIQESSRELEAELEAQIKQAEHQVRELRSNNHRLLIEHNSLKVRSSVNQLCVCGS